MQTIRVPYTVDPEGHQTITALRQVQSSAVRSAYANAARLKDGHWVFSTENDLWHLVKQRFGTEVLDSWGFALRRAHRLVEAPAGAGW